MKVWANAKHALTCKEIKKLEVRHTLSRCFSKVRSYSDLVH